MAMHVHFNYTYISLPSCTKQQREIIPFRVVYRKVITRATYCWELLNLGILISYFWEWIWPGAHDGFLIWHHWTKWAQLAISEIGRFHTREGKLARDGKLVLAEKPGRDEFLTGNRLNLSVLFLCRNRRFFEDEFFVETGDSSWIHAQDGELDGNCVIRSVNKLGLESGQRIMGNKHGAQEEEGEEEDWN